MSEELSPEVFDAGDGIDLVVHLGNGCAVTVFLSDEGAQSMIDVIQNKLNGRFIDDD